MSNIKVNVTQNGTTTLATEGCYCERDIDVIVNAPDRYEEGRKAEYDAFWDSFQQNGNRQSYNLAFGGYWGRQTFKPKYDIVPTTLNSAFHSLCQNDTEWYAFDMVEHLQELGVVLDTSICTNFTSAFMWAHIGRIGVIDCRAAKSGLTGTFAYGKIKTIDKVIVNDGNTYPNTFASQGQLENITFEGVIGAEISFKDCTKLSKASIESVVGALSSTTSGLTLTLSRTAKQAAFTDEQWAALIATKPNWTISLV